MRVRAALQRLPSRGPRSCSSSRPSPAKQASPLQASASRSGSSQTRGGVVKSTSSEYDTTDTENESDWSSEANGGEGGGEAKKGMTKALTTEESQLHVAAEEVQRQNDMFTKMPKWPYLNLNRPPPGLLSQLLNPDLG